MYLYLKSPDVFLDIGPDDSPFTAAQNWFERTWPDPGHPLVIMVVRRTKGGQERMFRFLVADGSLRSLKRRDAECDLCGRIGDASDFFQGGLAINSLGRQFILTGMFCEDCHCDMMLVPRNELPTEAELKAAADKPLLGELDAPELIRVCDAPGLARVLVANAREETGGENDQDFEFFGL
jgi:hypothetical protein